MNEPAAFPPRRDVALVCAVPLALSVVRAAADLSPIAGACALCWAYGVAVHWRGLRHRQDGSNAIVLSIAATIAIWIA